MTRAPQRVSRIGILTGGGDAPGLNAVIRAVVKAAANRNCETIGLEDGFNGLIEPNRWRRLSPRDVTGILRVGGTILGTTNRGNPFAYAARDGDAIHDYSDQCVEMFHHLSLDALVVIGGDGTLAIAHAFSARGIPIVGVPKTIDNDIVETTNTFGFDTVVGRTRTIPPDFDVIRAARAVGISLGD
jgi:ATP-dependent phosphofructokinase / diphosphate-dependent phosphofructokinase